MRRRGTVSSMLPVGPMQRRNRFTVLAPANWRLGQVNLLPLSKKIKLMCAYAVPSRRGCVKTRCGAKSIEWVFIRSRLAEIKLSRAGDFDQREKYHSHLRRAFGVFTQPARGGLSVSAAWRRFVAGVEALPPDQATPLWRAAQAQAAAVCNVGSPKASPTCPAHLSIL
jgi:hypothetical protein